MEVLLSALRIFAAFALIGRPIDPLSALVFGALWLGEPVTADLIIAMVGVGLGIYLVNRRR